MDLSTVSPTKWTNRLAFDIALRLEGSGEDLDEIVTRHQIVAGDLLVFNKDPVFLRKVSDFRDEIRDKGVTFRLKARTQAEELLKTSWMLIHDPVVSPAVKADLIKSTVKWAGLEPKNDVGDGAAAGGVGRKKEHAVEQDGRRRLRRRQRNSHGHEEALRAARPP